MTVKQFNEFVRKMAIGQDENLFWWDKDNHVYVPIANMFVVKGHMMVAFSNETEYLEDEV